MKVCPKCHVRFCRIVDGFAWHQCTVCDMDEQDTLIDVSCRVWPNDWLRVPLQEAPEYRGEYYARGAVRPILVPGRVHGAIYPAK